MKKINNLTITQNETGISAELGGNHSIAAVKMAFSSPMSGHIEIKHAQNNILSELISFADLVLHDESEIEISPNSPVSASHIFISFPNLNAKIKDISVYENEQISSADCYPSYSDLILGKNHYLDTVTVFNNSAGYAHYSIYTGMNENSLELLAHKSDNKSCDEHTGDRFDAQGREARIIRVYTEYYSASTKNPLKKITFTGTPSDTPVSECEPIDIPTFENSIYNKKLTPSDTRDELYGIVERRLGKDYCSWFEFAVKKNPLSGHNYDYFNLAYIENKIHITASNGTSLAFGLNYYLKHYCNVNISQVGDNAYMPNEIVPLSEPVFRETKAKIRYAYNYCTLSYSMAFWGEKEWRDELDWLALNGVNAVLDATAQEEVWRRFLGKLGYTHSEIKKYIAGPAYYAWAYMANMFGYGGPIHDNWFKERTELARKNHLIMRKLGIMPILQGYSGMVPPDICEHDKNAEVISQGTWCSFTRPYMLVTTSKAFGEYASKFYQSQKEVFGNSSHFFATDPFHEGGITAGLSPREIAKEVLSAMCRATPEAVWVIQSWQENPSSELLAGIEDISDGREHALVLDLYAEKTPNYPKGGSNSPCYGYQNEFNKTPWLYCMLNNFGGRLGLHGHLDNLAREIPKVFNNCEKISGIGITPEASVNNPVLYDFLFECIWQENAAEPTVELNLSDYLRAYCRRRYGHDSTAAKLSWEILKETVYKAELNNLGQGAPESVLNARPSLNVSAASTWGNAVISYDKKELEKAAILLFKDYDILKESNGYIYDLVTVVQQVLSNRAQDLYDQTVRAFNDKDAERFDEYSQKFLKIADDMELVLGCSEYYMLGRWIAQARTLAENSDDFTKMLYEFNAKSLITTWGSYDQSETGQLHDYSNRQWAGLIKSFYKPRWEKMFKKLKAQLCGLPIEDSSNPFEEEWSWIWKKEDFPTTPSKINPSEFKRIIEYSD